MENGLLDAAPVFTDVTTFPWRDYAPFMAGGILSFGWPCQPVSTAGKRKATEDERWLFDIIADGISILCPGMLFAENVEGLLSARMPDGSSVFGHCIERLESLHYKVAAGIFSASEVGAVHQRKRVFIMAHRKDERFQFWKTQRWGLTNRGERTEVWDQSIGQGGVSGKELAHRSDEGLQGGKRFWQARAQGVSSGYAAECSSNTWPSRPGQPQYAWEPPRVVGSVPEKLANFCSRDAQQGRDTAQASSEGVGDRREGADAMPHGGSSLCGGDKGDEPPRVVENSKLVGRGRGDHGDAGGLRGEIQTAGSCGRSEDGANQQPEMLGQGHEAMGNSECRRRTGRDVNRETTKDIGTGCINGNENSECSKIEPEMGRDIDGTTYGVDISELSSLSHFELAEIREWMVKGDNRTDELRSCGNGVVPATAERAFRVLMEELINK